MNEFILETILIVATIAVIPIAVVMKNRKWLVGGMICLLLIANIISYFVFDRVGYLYMSVMLMLASGYLLLNKKR